MKERIFDGRLAERIAGDDAARTERLKAVARTLVGVVRDGLVRDGTVRVHGFGTFQLRETRAHAGVNPATGERIMVPARHRVIFRPAKALRERVDPEPGKAVPLNEPQPSREALLAGIAVAPTSATAGKVPPGSPPAQSPATSDRPPVAAAAMPDSTLRSTRDRDVRPSDDAGDAGDTAAPTAAAEAPAVTPVAAAEPVAAGPVDSGDAANTGDAADTGAPDEREPRYRYRALALLALIALIGLLAWLLWPSSTPVREPEETPIVRADETPAEAAAETSIAPDEPAAVGSEVPAVPPELAGGSGESEASVRAEDVPSGPPALEAGRAIEIAPGIAAVPVDPATAAAVESDTGAADAAGPATLDEVLARLGGVPDPTGASQGTDASESTGAAGTESGSAATADPDVAAGTSVDPVGTPTDPAAGAAGEAWFTAREYAVEPGDTLWGIATRHYLDPYYWPHIYNHNSAGLPDPDRLAIDQQLLLPALQGSPGDLSAADRTSIAEGYLRLYHFWVERGEANAHYALIAVRVFDADVLPDALASNGAAYPRDTMGAIYEAQLTHRYGR